MRSKTDNHFRKYHKLVKKYAWSFHTSTGVSFEDLHAQGCLSYVRSCLSWRSGKGKFSTWLVWNIRSDLIDMVNKEQKHQVLDYTDNEKDYSTSEENLFDRLRLIGDEDLQRLVVIIVNKRFTSWEDVSSYCAKTGWSEDRLKAVYVRGKELVAGL